MSCTGRWTSALMKINAGFESKMQRKTLLGYAGSAYCCSKTIKLVNWALKAKEPKLDMIEITCLRCWDLEPRKTKMLKRKFHAIALRGSGFEKVFVTVHRICKNFS